MSVETIYQIGIQNHSISFSKELGNSGSLLEKEDAPKSMRRQLHTEYGFPSRLLAFLILIQDCHPPCDLGNIFFLFVNDLFKVSEMLSV